MAAGFGESYIRLWSLTGKGLKQLRTDLKGDEVSKINDGVYPAQIRTSRSFCADSPYLSSERPQKTIPPFGTTNPQAHRSLWPRLLPLIRSRTRTFLRSSIPPLMFRRHDDPTVVPRNVHEFGRVSRAPRTSVGRRMGSEGNLLCECESGSNSEVVDHGQDQRGADLCRSP